MTKSEKVEFIQSTLDRLEPETPIPLDHSDPYTLLIAVLVSAQCTDLRVNLVTPALFQTEVLDGTGKWFVVFPSCGYALAVL